MMNSLNDQLDQLNQSTLARSLKLDESKEELSATDLMSSVPGCWVSRAPSPARVPTAECSEEQLLTAARYQCTQTLHGHQGTIWSMVVLADPERLVSGAWDNTVRIWDCETGQLLHTLKGHTDWIRALVAVSGIGGLVASGSNDATVMLWDTVSGQLAHTLRGHDECVCSLAVLSDGRTLASGSEDESIRLWDCEKGAMLCCLNGHDGSIESLVSMRGMRLASGSDDNTITIWDCEAHAAIHTLEEHSDCVNWLLVARGGKTLASASEDGTVKLWDSSTGVLQHTLSGHRDSVTSLVALKDPTQLVSVSKDETVKVWSCETGQMLQSFRGHAATVLWDGITIAVVLQNGAVHFWSSVSGSLLAVLADKDHSVWTVAVLPHKRAVVSSSEGVIKLWSIQRLEGASTSAIEQQENQQLRGRPASSSQSASMTTISNHTHSEPVGSSSVKQLVRARRLSELPSSILGSLPVLGAEPIGRERPAVLSASSARSQSTACLAAVESLNGSEAPATREKLRGVSGEQVKSNLEEIQAQRTQQQLQTGLREASAPKVAAAGGGQKAATAGGGGQKAAAAGGGQKVAAAGGGGQKAAAAGGGQKAAAAEVDDKARNTATLEDLRLMPYMKLKKWLKVSGQIPLKLIDSCLDVQQLLTLYDKYPAVHTVPKVAITQAVTQNQHPKISAAQPTAEAAKRVPVVPLLQLPIMTSTKLPAAPDTSPSPPTPDTPPSPPTPHLDPDTPPSPPTPVLTHSRSTTPDPLARSPEQPLQNGLREQHTSGQGLCEQTRQRVESSLEEVMIAPAELKALISEIERLGRESSEANSRLQRLGGLMQSWEGSSVDGLVDELEQKLQSQGGNRATQGEEQAMQSSVKFEQATRMQEVLRKQLLKECAARKSVEEALAANKAQAEHSVRLAAEQHNAQLLKECAARNRVEKQLEEALAANEVLKRELEKDQSRVFAVGAEQDDSCPGISIDHVATMESQVSSAESQVLELTTNLEKTADDVVAQRLASDAGNRDRPSTAECSTQASSTQASSTQASSTPASAEPHATHEQGGSDVFWLQQQLIQEHKEKLEIQKKLTRAERMINSLSGTQF